MSTSLSFRLRSTLGSENQRLRGDAIAAFLDRLLEPGNPMRAQVPFDLMIDTMVTRSAERVPCDEVAIDRFARAGDRTACVLALAGCFELPPAFILRCFEARRPSDVILIACRSRTFAWSTVASLIAHVDVPRHDLDMALLYDDYHLISIVDAQRIMRLARLRLREDITGRPTA